MRKILLIFCMLLSPVWAQDEITQVSYFGDQFGNLHRALVDQALQDLLSAGTGIAHGQLSCAFESGD